MRVGSILQRKKDCAPKVKKLTQDETKERFRRRRAVRGNGKMARKAGTLPKTPYRLKKIV
jgi:hypothetical protein